MHEKEEQPNQTIPSRKVLIEEIVKIKSELDEIKILKDKTFRSTPLKRKPVRTVKKKTVVKRRPVRTVKKKTVVKRRPVRTVKKKTDKRRK